METRRGRFNPVGCVCSKAFQGITASNQMDAMKNLTCEAVGRRRPVREAQLDIEWTQGLGFDPLCSASGRQGGNGCGPSVG